VVGEEAGERDDAPDAERDAPVGDPAEERTPAAPTSARSLAPAGRPVVVMDLDVVAPPALPRAVVEARLDPIP
jgi:hypothetical protein